MGVDFMHTEENFHKGEIVFVQFIDIVLLQKKTWYTVIKVLVNFCIQQFFFEMQVITARMIFEA